MEPSDAPSAEHHEPTSGSVRFADSIAVNEELDADCAPTQQPSTPNARAAAPPRSTQSRRSMRQTLNGPGSAQFPIQGKRIRICFNGDRFAKPIAYSISAFKTFDAFLRDVNGKVGRSPSLLYGARYIFDSTGKQIEALSELHHNCTYICASTLKFVVLNYERVGVPKWHSALNSNAQINNRPSVTRCTYRSTFRRKRQNSAPSEAGDDFNASQTTEAPDLPNAEIIEFLGRGHSADVYKARSLERGQLFAAKVIPLRDTNMREFVMREIGIMKHLVHCEHIVKMYRTYEWPSVGQIIELELLTGGDLFEHMRAAKVLDEYNCASVIGCIASAIAYMHTLSICHRDLKPENCLVISAAESERLRVKITDFGLATQIARNQVLFTVCGTPTYVPPEVIAKEGYSFEVDAWSTGIIMFLLLAGYPPFFTSHDEQYELFEQILEAKPDLSADVLPDVSASARLILRRLLVRWPAQRMKASELAAEKWVQDPRRITEADETLATRNLERIELRLAAEAAHGHQPPPSLLKKRRRTYSQQTLPADRTHASSSASRRNSTLRAQLARAKKRASLPLQPSSSAAALARPRSSTTTSDEDGAHADSDDATSESGEDAKLANVAAGFVFYRPQQAAERNKAVC